MNSTTRIRFAVRFIACRFLGRHWPDGSAWNGDHLAARCMICNIPITRDAATGRHTRLYIQSPAMQDSALLAIAALESGTAINLSAAAQHLRSTLALIDAITPFDPDALVAAAHAQNALDRLVRSASGRGIAITPHDADHQPFQPVRLDQFAGKCGAIWQRSASTHS